VTTPPEPPDTSLTPLARARRRLEARLRRLEDQLNLDNKAEDEALWTRYLDVVNTLANLGGQAAPPMVTTQQLAESLGCSPDTIRELVKQGRLEPAAKFGRRGGFRFRAGQRPTPR
jgi:excisionase family DNA binding protein